MAYCVSCESCERSIRRLHPAVDGQDLGESKSKRWLTVGAVRGLSEDYILQWTDKA